MGVRVGDGGVGDRELSPRDDGLLATRAAVHHFYDLPQLINLRLLIGVALAADL